MFSLEKNGTWIVVPKPKNVRVIGSKYGFTPRKKVSLGLSLLGLR